MNKIRRELLLKDNLAEDGRYLHDVGMTDAEIAARWSRKLDPILAKAKQSALTKQDVYNIRTDGAFLPPLEADPVQLLRPARPKLLVTRKRNDWLTEDSVKLLLDSDNQELLDAYTALACTLSQANDPATITLRSFRDIMMVITAQHPADQVLRTISAMYQLTLAYVETAFGQHGIEKEERSAYYYAIYKMMLRDGFDGGQALLLWQDFVSEASSRVEDGIIVDDE